MEKSGICTQTLIAVRTAPAETAELSTQLIFGEPYEVINKEDKWLNIRLFADDYTGWIDAKLYTPIDEQLHENIRLMKFTVSNKTLDSMKNISNNSTLPLVAGSIIWNMDNAGSFSIHNTRYKANTPSAVDDDLQTALITYAKQFLNAPYLWGGKSVLGIDCSGLSQLCYHLIGKHIPRDASQQVSQGKTINFVGEAAPGDLAFFANEEGTINHVGILISSSEIIHASGWVKIDHFDQQGIYSKAQNKYTHKLRTIKRIL